MATTTSRPAAKKAVAKKTPAKRVVRKKHDESVVHEYRAYIPDPSVSQRYVGRKINGVFDAVLADVASENGENVLLMGDTGAGKTLFGEAYASLRRRPYYSLPCDVSIDPPAIIGRLMPTEEVGKFEWQDGPVTEIVRGPCGLGDKCEDPNCIAGVLNISEINMMTPKIAASMYSLLDGRRYLVLLGHKGEVVRAHRGLLIVADMNPNYRGTIELNAAFFNRFDHKVLWGYEDAVEERLVNFPTLRDIAKKLRDMNGGEIITPVSTNMLMEFEKFAMEPRLGVEYATANFVTAFTTDERSAVARTFELNEESMKKDMAFHERKLRADARRAKQGGRNVAVDDDDDAEEIDVEFEEED